MTPSRSTRTVRTLAVWGRLLVHHYVCVGHGACTRRVIYGIASSYWPTTHHAHALCITFLPPKSVAKSKEKHKAPKRVAKGASRLRRSRWSFFVRDIWGVLRAP